MTEASTSAGYGVDSGAGDPLTEEPRVEKTTPGGYAVLVILSAAMFVYVIDTTVMNVSISALVEDLDTTVGGVQAAITLYTLTMASFMLTGGKLGDIWGSKRGVPDRAGHLRHRHDHHCALAIDRYVDCWLVDPGGVGFGSDCSRHQHADSCQLQGGRAAPRPMVFCGVWPQPVLRSGLSSVAG